MNESLVRIAAIVRADFFIRFRRISTLVVFLILSWLAWLWIPDPSTGRALIQIAGKRALYNSAAIGMATATLATIFIGLVGFYVISNAVGRDLASRTGFVIASTPVRNREYVAGKFLGNLLFLAVFTSGFMVSSMIVQLVRGEAPLQPLIFAQQYLLLVAPALVAVSAFAIVFESIRFLSGKFGDVAWFFLWIASVGTMVPLMEQGLVPDWIRLFDFSGFGFLFHELQQTFQTKSLSIGSSSFDASLGTIVFEGFGFKPEWIAYRLGAALTPLPLLLIPLLFFHRFDPARVRVSGERGHRKWIGRLDARLKPLTRVLLGFVGWARRGGSLPGSAATDGLVTFAARPFFVVVAVGLAIAALATPAADVFKMMSIVFLALGVILADVATRDQRAGTLQLLYATPHLKSGFVWFKLGASLMVALAIGVVPLLRIASADISATVPVIIGMFFVASAATAFGLIAGTPKAFLAVFLMFWYIAVSDSSRTPELDFGGFHQTATPAVWLGYFLLAIGFLIAAEAVHRWRLRTEW